jgi:hypothetical protein
MRKPSAALECSPEGEATGERSEHGEPPGRRSEATSGRDSGTQRYVARSYIAGRSTDYGGRAGRRRLTAWAFYGAEKRHKVRLFAPDFECLMGDNHHRNGMLMCTL